jgi:hypothetical protein
MAVASLGQHSGADLVYPLAVRAAAHFIAWLDCPAASRADLARSVRLVVLVRLRRELIGARLMFFRCDAELLLSAFFDLGAPEVRRSCHHVPLCWSRVRPLRLSQ